MGSVGKRIYSVYRHCCGCLQSIASATCTGCTVEGGQILYRIVASWKGREGRQERRGKRME